MIKPIPGKISNQEFKKLLSENKGYIAKNIADGLDSAGLKRLLYEKTISKKLVTKAIKALQEQGVMSEHRRPGQLYEEAGGRQRDFDEAARTEKIKTNARLGIKIELEDEAAAMENGLDYLKHDKRGVLGQSVYEDLKEEQENRDKKIKDQADKKEKFDAKKSNPANRPKLADLPDMDIG